MYQKREKNSKKKILSNIILSRMRWNHEIIIFKLKKKFNAHFSKKYIVLVFLTFLYP